MQYIAGWDPLDESSTRKKVPVYTRTIENSSIKGLRIGIPRNYFLDHVSSQFESLFYNCIEILESAGSVVLYDLDLHDTDLYQKTWQKIRLAETAEIHTKWLKTRAKEYSREVRQMLVQGEKIPAVDYISAANLVKKVRKEFLSILNSKVDVIMVPTTIISAPKFDEESIITDNTAVLHTREALLQNTILFNCIGLPAISVPIGLTKGKMPIAAQIIGPPFMEETIMSMAYHYEGINKNLEMFIPPILS
jgi:aspartyl-tRNA(Asn)/glutamyl-tRNA(Gln) amidotransferase subunit A